VLELSGEHRLALELREALGVDQELGAHEPPQLTHVRLRHQHAAVGAQHLTGVGGQRVEMKEVGGRDLAAPLANAAHARFDRSVARAPAEHEQLGAILVVDLQRRDVVRDALDLLRSQAGHAGMIFGVVADVAGAVLLLEPADSVAEPDRAGDRPWAGEALVAQVGEEVAAQIGSLGEARVDLRQVLDVGDQPRLRGAGEERVGEKDHGCAVIHREPDGLERRIEAVRRCRRGDHRQRRLAMAAVERHQQVGRLGLGRHAGRRAGPLDVDDHHRQLERHCEADRLGLEVHAGAARRGHSELAPERGAERHVRSGDLVLGLDQLDAETSLARELVQQLRGGGYRVAGEQQRQPAGDARRDQPERGRGGAVDVAVRAGPQRGGLDVVLNVKQLGGLAEVVARVERCQIGRQDWAVLGELLLDPLLRHLHGTRVHPRQDAECEQVLGACAVATGHALDVLGGPDGHARHRQAMDVKLGETAVLERVGVVARLREVALVERVVVDHDRRATLERVDVRLQRGRIHRHEHVRRVARGEDVTRGEVDLEGGHAPQRPRGRANLGRVVGCRRKVVPEDRRRVGETPADELHTVARVARNTDDNPILIDGSRHHRPSFPPRDRQSLHSWLQQATRPRRVP
jgi:hypothetical protein